MWLLKKSFLVCKLLRWILLEVNDDWGTLHLTLLERGAYREAGITTEITEFSTLLSVVPHLKLSF